MCMTPSAAASRTAFVGRVHMRLFGFVVLFLPFFETV